MYGPQGPGNWRRSGRPTGPGRADPVARKHRRRRRLRRLFLAAAILEGVLGLVVLTLGGLVIVRIVNCHDTLAPLWHVPPGLLLASGVMALLACVLGVIGVARRSAMLIILFLAVLVAVIVIQAVAARDAARLQRGFKGSVKADRMRQWFKDSTSLDDIDLRIIDLQSVVYCCGYNGVRDYKRYDFDVPESCCNDDKEDCSPSAKSLRGPCKDKLPKMAHREAVLLLVLALVVILIQVPGLILGVLVVIAVVEERQERKVAAVMGARRHGSSSTSHSHPSHRSHRSRPTHQRLWATTPAQGTSEGQPAEGRSEARGAESNVAKIGESPSLFHRRQRDRLTVPSERPTEGSRMDEGSAGSSWARYSTASHRRSSSLPSSFAGAQFPSHDREETHSTRPSRADSKDGRRSIISKASASRKSRRSSPRAASKAEARESARRRATERRSHLEASLASFSQRHRTTNAPLPPGVVASVANEDQPPDSTAMLAQMRANRGTQATQAQERHRTGGSGS